VQVFASLINFSATPAHLGITIPRSDASWHAGPLLAVPMLHDAKEGSPVDLTIWLPGMFVLGVASMLLCYAFIAACEKI